MRRALTFACAATFALTACSEQQTTSDMSEAIAGPAQPEASADAASEVAVEHGADDAPAVPAALPSLAFDYGMAFELESAKIGRLMRAHADACEEQGPASCRVIGMDLGGKVSDDSVHGTLTLAVAAGHARAVAALVEDEAADAGAEQASSSIASEEVSKTIVDTEARIRAREDLRDRLTEVLRTRKGSVKELVEAERNVAQVNEEIDQARSWLAETKGRVAFSKLSIDYAPPTGAAASFTAPVTGALGSIGAILGNVLGALIVLLAIALPLGGLAAAALWLRRRLRAAPAA